MDVLRVRFPLIGALAVSVLSMAGCHTLASRNCGHQSARELGSVTFSPWGGMAQSLTIPPEGLTLSRAIERSEPGLHRAFLDLSLQTPELTREPREDLQQALHDEIIPDVIVLIRNGTVWMFPRELCLHPALGKLPLQPGDDVQTIPRNQTVFGQDVFPETPGSTFGVSGGSFGVFGPLAPVAGITSTTDDVLLRRRVVEFQQLEDAPALKPAPGESSPFSVIVVHREFAGTPFRFVLPYLYSVELGGEVSVEKLPQGGFDPLWSPYKQSLGIRAGDVFELTRLEWALPRA